MNIETPFNIADVVRFSKGFGDNDDLRRDTDPPLQEWEVQSMTYFHMYPDHIEPANWGISISRPEKIQSVGVHAIELVRPACTHPLVYGFDVLGPSDLKYELSVQCPDCKKWVKSDA